VKIFLNFFGGKMSEVNFLIQEMACHFALSHGRAWHVCPFIGILVDFFEPAEYRFTSFMSLRFNGTLVHESWARAAARNLRDAAGVKCVSGELRDRSLTAAKPPRDRRLGTARDRCAASVGQSAGRMDL